MQALAVLLALAGASCFYLAAPNQVLHTPIHPRLSFGLGLALTVASAWVMSMPEGWPVAIAATLVTLTCSLSAWPFIGVWRQRQRIAARNSLAEGGAP